MIDAPVVGPKTWPDVVDTLLHYIAGGLILGGAGFLEYHDKITQADFIVLLFAAAVAVGFKMSK